LYHEPSLPSRSTEVARISPASVGRAAKVKKRTQENRLSHPKPRSALSFVLYQRTQRLRAGATGIQNEPKKSDSPTPIPRSALPYRFVPTTQPSNAPQPRLQRTNPTNRPVPSNPEVRLPRPSKRSKLHKQSHFLPHPTPERGDEPKQASLYQRTQLCRRSAIQNAKTNQKPLSSFSRAKASLHKGAN